MHSNLLLDFWSIYFLYSRNYCCPHPHEMRYNINRTSGQNVQIFILHQPPYWLMNHDNLNCIMQHFPLFIMILIIFLLRLHTCATFTCFQYNLTTVNTYRAVTTPSDDTNPFFCHVPSTDTDVSAVFLSQCNSFAASGILHSATTFVASFKVFEMKYCHRYHSPLVLSYS